MWAVCSLHHYLVLTLDAARKAEALWGAVEMASEA